MQEQNTFWVNTLGSVVDDLEISKHEFKVSIFGKIFDEILVVKTVLKTTPNLGFDKFMES